MVSEGIHCDLWEFRLNLFGDVVRERKHGAAVAAFGIVERLAIGTFAGSGPIILGDRNDVAVGTFAQPFSGPLHDEVAELGIGEAKLGAIVRSDVNLAVTKTNGAPAIITGIAYLRDSLFLRDLADLVPGKVASTERRPPPTGCRAR